MLLGMRPALGWGRSSGQDSWERLEQLLVASPVAFPKVRGMKLLVVMLSQVLSGASGAPFDATGSSSSEVLPVMIGETDTSYDVSMSLP